MDGWTSQALSRRGVVMARLLLHVSYSRVASQAAQVPLLRRRRGLCDARRRWRSGEQERLVGEGAQRRLSSDLGQNEWAHGRSRRRRL